MADALPYLAEYSKSNRAACKKCKEKIEKDVLRLAVVVQSAKFDGKMTNWYHFDCFFERQRPKSVGDIEHFDQLRWEDQEKIKAKLATLGEVVATPAKGKGRAKAKGVASAGQHPDYNVEYAKSGRAGCRGCEQKILKGEIRVSKKCYDSEGAMKYGPQDLWHHVQCFKERRDELEFTGSAEIIGGFANLSAEDQAMLKKELPACAVKHKLEGTDVADGTDPQAKKVKKEKSEKSDKSDKKAEKEAKAKKAEEDKERDEIKKQNKIMYKHRDDLEQLSKAELQLLLEHNGQQPPTGPSKMLDLLADVMTFGALLVCAECGGKGQLVYKTGVGYECTGSLSEWTKCPATTRQPPRKPFVVPRDLAEQYGFLNKYKYVERQRIIPALPAPSVKKEVAETPSKSASTSKSTSSSKSKSESASQKESGPMLKGLVFTFDAKLEKDKEKSQDVRRRLEQLGGRVSSRLTDQVAAVVSGRSKIKTMDSRMEKARELGVHVVAVDVIDEFESVESKTKASAAFLISKKNFAPWAKNIEERLALNGDKESKSSSSKKKSSSKSLPDKVRLTLKGGGVVDPDSGLADSTHVLKADAKDLYSVVLGVVDIQHDRNSYYKLQILQADKGHKYWLFRSWGRVGTTIGDNKLESMDDRGEAVERFVALYEEKTGNAWKNRHQFIKQPGKFYPLDIDYGDTASSSVMSSATSKSKLPPAIKDLVCMLFDVESMKRAMVEFELDLTKLPLGKISRKQIERAYTLLGQVDALLRDADQVRQAQLIDVSNQFYTLIPHDFGRKKPPLLDSLDLVKTKLEMLESLLEIEVAYSLLKAGDAEEGKDPIDAHYEKLRTRITVLDRQSDEFETIQTYVRNTHAATHSQYSLDIEEVFKVERKGESSRYRPFSKLPNRRLLWHGSRVTNVAGILSQGLRIAPPEAPVTGYMFGKGIYFADMVSKSANYCATSRSNPHGLMLLCEVALGNMYERTQADYIEKLPKGYQSVLGVGKTEPDPEASKVVDHVQVPLGQPRPSKVKSTSLLYNEFIVYDVAQVNLKYLLKMKFNYK